MTTRNISSEVNIEKVEESIHPYETTPAAPDVKPVAETLEVATTSIEESSSRAVDPNQIEDIELIE